MKISQIQPLQKKLNNSYFKENNMPYSKTDVTNAGMTYADGIQNNQGVYGKAQVLMNQSPSFKAFGLDDLLLLLAIFSPFIAAATMSIIEQVKTNYQTKAYEKERLLKEARVKAQFEKDMTKFANTMNLSPKNAKAYFEKYLATSHIESEGIANKEIGMNAVMGYSLEKYKLIKDVLTPVVVAQRANNKAKRSEDIEDKVLAAKAREKVPNGILLYGPPGTGKTHIAEKICEHLEHFGAGFEKLTLSLGVGKNLARIEEITENAKNKFERTGEYTVVLLNDFTSVLRKGAREFDTMLNTIETAKDNGMIFIMTTNSPEEIDKAVLREGRINHKILIGEMENFENAEMINYALHSYAETREKAKDFDIQKVVDKMSEEKWQFTPAEFMGFAQKMANSKIITADEMIELMETLSKPDELGYAWNTYTPEVIKEMEEQKRYIQKIDKKNKKLSKAKRNNQVAETKEIGDMKGKGKGKIKSSKQRSIEDILREAEGNFKE